MKNLRKIIISGTGSGCGKTTVTCAVLSAFVRRGMTVKAFKCGPDYIDPMFHSHITGTDSHNLDSFFCDKNIINYILCEKSKNADISVIEGVMGFYDGGDGSSDRISDITETPAVIVINARGMRESLGAVVKGFLSYKKNRIAGFIFNNLPEKLSGFAEELCESLGTEYLGFMPKTDFTIESRNLGLVTACEIENLDGKIAVLGELAEKNINLDRILEIAKCREIPHTAPVLKKIKIEKTESVRVAVARDSAFCFIYPDNIDVLEKLGLEIKFFSPISDRKIPDGASGLILSGGYPELYAEKLSGNVSMLESVKRAVQSGMPVIAECGGFIYLHNFFEDLQKNLHRGVGVIDGTAKKTDKLVRFGYINICPDSDSLLFRRGERVPAHEFHYFDSTANGESLTAIKASGLNYRFGHCSENMYAGFPHIYFYSNIKTAERFAAACGEFAEGKNF